MILLWFLAGAAWQAASPPPPLLQLSADCAHPVYASDQLVCSDPILLALDRQLVGLLPQSLKAPSPLIEDQEAWFRRSRQCAFRLDHAACVAQAYRDRIAVLRAAMSPVSELPARCSRTDLVAIAGDGGTIILTRDRTVVAVATPARPAWQPFVSYRRSGHVTTLHNFAGAVIARCRSSEN